MDVRKGVSRRSLLLGGFGSLVLAGCASPYASHVGERSPIPSEPILTPPVPSTSVIPEPEIVAASPDIEAIIASHQGMHPTEWGLAIPGVAQSTSDLGVLDAEQVLLTLDACGGEYGSRFDEHLITGLLDRGVPAVLFLNLRWIDKNPQVARDLAAEPLFTLGNHGTTHSPLSVTGESAYGIPGTGSVREAANEVHRNHIALTELTGIEPQWFRPGTAHLDDVGLSIVRAMHEQVVGFSVNGDEGATLSVDEVAQRTAAAQPGDIIIAHMNQPESGTAAGVLRAVDKLTDEGIVFGFA